MKELEYPFDSEYIMRKKKSIRKTLLSSDREWTEKRIAILGGSTTNDITLVLELFLLHYGIKPEFYESEYNQFYQDAVFGNEELDHFAPDIIFIHTTNRNILHYPVVGDDETEVEQKFRSELERYTSVWEKLRERFSCPVIQNNFEYPFYRLLGNKDASDIHGRVNFITRLNLEFAQYAREHDNLYINDINYQSSVYGLDRWSDEFYWYMYKYALTIAAIPVLAYNVANMIKAIYGKNKKALALDLDNTLWGGIVGDDGVENLEIGKETAIGEAFLEFQEYLQSQKQLGILLNINSKNDIANAIAGLHHPQSALKQEDFVVIKANWEPKSANLRAMAEELNIGLDSIVFVDDNPAEREIVYQQCPEVSAPDMGDRPEKYIRRLDRSGFFECVSLSGEDFGKTEMYRQNAKRAAEEKQFANYEDYLLSLNMKARIEPFIPLYMQRIAQLTNKSNQFNLTTRRYTQSEIERIAQDRQYITLYGSLEDKFGDNGVVSVVIGHITENVMDIDLWLMSCRVLKRDMEYAMMDELAEAAKRVSVDTIYGYYYPTAKNGMVRDFYKLQGFDKVSEDEKGNTKWQLKLEDYHKQNQYIRLKKK